jgi:DNA-binding transcriptional ArsR family regulator
VRSPAITSRSEPGVAAEARLDGLFRALADPTRRAMLARLRSGPATVGELAAPFAMSLAAASKHVKVLERAGLVRRTVYGRTHRCALEPAPLAAGDEWLRYYERFWSRRLDALDAALREDDARRTPRTKKKGRRK